MPGPDQHPNDRPPAEVAAPDSYLPAAPVWVYRGGQWRPGRVEQASTRAVQVRYRPTNQRGTGVDTVTAPYVAPRVDVDDLLDGPGGPGATRAG